MPLSFIQRWPPSLSSLLLSPSLPSSSFPSFPLSFSFPSSFPLFFLPFIFFFFSFIFGKLWDIFKGRHYRSQVFLNHLRIQRFPLYYLLIQISQRKNRPIFLILPQLPWFYYLAITCAYVINPQIYIDVSIEECMPSFSDSRALLCCSDLHFQCCLHKPTGTQHPVTWVLFLQCPSHDNMFHIPITILVLDSLQHLWYPRDQPTWSRGSASSTQVTSLRWHPWPVS